MTTTALKAASIDIVSPGVNVAVVKKDDDGWKFLLLQRAETETYPGCWGLLTGSKQRHETAAQIVAREMKEETGLTAQRIWSTEYLVEFYEPEFDQIWVLPLFVAVVAKDVDVRLQPENSEFCWVDSAKARKQVTWKNLMRAIEEIAAELEVYPARTWVEVIP